MQNWLISANSNMYDHASSFAKNGYIDWKQNKYTYKINDIVYIYCTHPVKKIMFKTIVKKVNMSFSECTDDKEFWYDLKEYRQASDGNYFRLELVKEIDSDKLSLENLKKHGLKAAPQGAMKINNKLLNYIEQYFADDYMEKFFESDLKRNIIYFGAPGTGKSYNLNHDKEDLLENYTNNYERVTFHPDYSYANFVGTYKPVPDGDSITYKYVPGPFMRILKKALEKPSEPFLLIIEEINRANVAAVFGDVFQLLDRENNESLYSIDATEDMKSYLNQDKIKIPQNMFIWATMNSADQGVFPMDTAFKRRWDFNYFNIDTGEYKIKNTYINLNNQKISWNKLRKEINKELSSYKINEDKLLGPFFAFNEYLNEEIPEEEFKEIFKNKIIMYLFEDAARSRRNNLFQGAQGDNNYVTYSQICELFDEKGIEIFCDNIKNEFSQEEEE